MVCLILWNSWVPEFIDMMIISIILKCHYFLTHHKNVWLKLHLRTAVRPYFSLFRPAVYDFCHKTPKILAKTESAICRAKVRKNKNWCLLLAPIRPWRCPYPVTTYNTADTITNFLTEQKNFKSHPQSRRKFSLQFTTSFFKSSKDITQWDILGANSGIVLLLNFHSMTSGSFSKESTKGHGPKGLSNELTIIGNFRLGSILQKSKHWQFLTLFTGKCLFQRHLYNNPL
jgi:hypothetical protein